MQMVKGKTGLTLRKVRVSVLTAVVVEVVEVVMMLKKVEHLSFYLHLYCYSNIHLYMDVLSSCA